jgi:hypothetical protein
LKPTQLEVVKIPTTNIGIAQISELEIDLEHINKGLNPSNKKVHNKPRSNYTGLEIAQIFTLLDGYFLNPAGKKDDYLYFAQTINIKNQNHLLVFCVHKNSTHVAGVITFYKIKEHK